MARAANQWTATSRSSLPRPAPLLEGNFFKGKEGRREFCSASFWNETISLNQARDFSARVMLEWVLRRGHIGAVFGH